VKLLLLVVLGICLAFDRSAKADETAHALKAADVGGSALVETNLGAEFDKIEAADDAAQTEVDKWVRQNNDLKSAGRAVSQDDMDHRIAERFEPVRQAYDNFVHKHPDYARARLGYGNFLNDRQDERGAQVQWERAIELDPTNAAIYNSLAGRYTEVGPVNKAFEYFSKAIELRPAEAAYYHNFGDGLYVQRKRAAVYYSITEQQVFDKVVTLYSNALRLAPRNFAYAWDLAQTYYSFKPLPFETSLGAWTNALKLAPEEADREEVLVHLARVNMLAGRFAEARNQLIAVTNESCLKAKASLLHNIAQREDSKP
jgi:tetratricopeptide (TPR) repeat protein